MLMVDCHFFHHIIFYIFDLFPSPSGNEKSKFLRDLFKTGHRPVFFEADVWHPNAGFVPLLPLSFLRMCLRTLRPIGD